MLQPSKICRRLINYSFYLLFFLTPLIVLPENYELFEFNKMIFVYILSIIILSAWLIKMICSKRIIFTRTPLDLPLLIFLASQILSFIFSADKHTSLWGYYSRFNGGLLSLITYLLLYWAFVSNFDRKKALRVFPWIISMAVIVSLYGILEHFGHSLSCLLFEGNFGVTCWVQDVQNRVFATLGQPNWLAAYLVILIPLTWGLALYAKSSFLINLFFSNLFFLCLAYTKSRSGFLGLTVAYAVFWLSAFTPTLLKRKKHFSLKNNPIIKPFLLFTINYLLLTIFIGTPWTPGLNSKIFSSPPPQTNAQKQTETSQAPSQAPLFISESSDIRKIVWKGALDIWRHHPVFGTGPETFAYSYYWYRPREHNDVSEWDFLYNKAHNEYLNYLATTGTVGFIGYLLVIAIFVFWTLKNPNVLNFMLLGSFSSILVTNFFGFSVVIVSLFFFLIPALAFVLSEKETNEENIQPAKNLSLGQQIPILLILLFTIYYLLFTIKFWSADILFAKGEKLNKSNQFDLAYNSLQQAVRKRPAEPIYHDELSWSAANLAVLFEKQKDASLSAQFTKTALAESSEALKASPYNTNFWKTRTKIYYKLAEIDSRYYQNALQSLLQASELAPTDAKIKYNLGLIYAQLDQSQTAITTLEDAVKLKPNYEDARFALALFYEQEKQKTKASEQLKYILEKINPQSQKAKERLESLEK